MVSEVEEGWRCWPEDAEEDGDGDGKRELVESKKGLINLPNFAHTLCSILEENRTIDQELNSFFSVPLSF